jgi:hypothetical protein
VPTILTAYVLYDYWPNLAIGYSSFVRILGSVLSPSLFYASVGYLIREVFRSTSKLIFQFPAVKENETKMPSTEFLLYSNKEMSNEVKDLTRKLVRDDFSYNMPTKNDEMDDIEESRKRIVEAFGFIKNFTRNSNLVLQCNYRYGFYRNTLGGLVWSFLVTFILLIFCIVFKMPFLGETITALIAILAQGAIIYIFMRFSARNYARTVINHYISQHRNEQD